MSGADESPADPSESIPVDPGPSSHPGSAHPLRNRPLLLILVGLFIIYIANSWSRDFWSPEEIEFAAICKEMASEEGSWLRPTLGGEPYNEKPPLLYWSGLIFQEFLFLEPHLAYRLPVAIFAVLGVWVTFLFGLRFFDERTARTGCLLHGTSLVYYGNAAWFRTDVPFAFGVSLALTALALGLTGPRVNRRWLLVGALGLAVASLFKTPLLALYLVGMPLLLLLWFQHGIRGALMRIVAARPARALTLYLVMVLPWYLYMLFSQGEGFVSENIGEHHLDRLVAATSHRQDGGYYFRSILADLVPWTPWLPLAVFFGFVHFKKAPVKFAFLWVLVTFGTLSLISSKQGKYLLPMWTPLCVLIVVSVAARARESIWEGFLGATLGRLFPYLFWVFAGACLVGAVALGADLLPERLLENYRDRLMTPGFRIRGAVVLTLAAAGVFALGWRVRDAFRKRAVHSGFAWAAAATGLVYFLGSFLYADLDRVKSGREFCRVAEEVIEDRPFAIYGTPRAGVLYYLDRRPDEYLRKLDPRGEEMEAQEALDAFLGAPGERFLIIYEKDRRELEANFGKYASLYQHRAEGTVGSRRTYQVLSNRIVVE